MVWLSVLHWIVAIWKMILENGKFVLKAFSDFSKHYICVILLLVVLSFVFASHVQAQGTVPRYERADCPIDVLVATTTTPAWTPLFAIASAVVTDIGGPLSHSSILVREYGIPAVMAARNATNHIKSGQTVTVDGKEGTVILENHR